MADLKLKIKKQLFKRKVEGQTKEISVPTPYPVIQPWPSQPLTPYYGQRWEVTCKMQDSE